MNRRAETKPLVSEQGRVPDRRSKESPGFTDRRLIASRSDDVVCLRDRSKQCGGGTSSTGTGNCAGGSRLPGNRDRPDLSAAARRLAAAGIGFSQCLADRILSSEELAFSRVSFVRLALLDGRVASLAVELSSRRRHRQLRHERPPTGSTLGKGGPISLDRAVSRGGSRQLAKS